MPDITKIKGNVASMIDQGAPESDIQAYLASEGTTVQDLRGARMTPDDETAYKALAADPKTDAAGLQGFARQRGFDVTDADAADFLSRRAANPNVGGPFNYKLPAAPPSSQSGLQRVSATAGEFLDGILPNAGKTMAGVGGVIGNGISAALGGNEFHPGQAYDEEAAAHEADQAALEAENPNVATGLGVAGLASSFLLPGVNAVRGGSLAGHMANGTLSGAAYGAAGGALNDSGDGRLANAGLGTAAGTVLGGVAAPVMRGAGLVASAARRNIPGVDATANFLESIPGRLRGTGAVPREAAAHAQADRILADQMDGSRNIYTGMGTGHVPSTPQNVASETIARQRRGVPAVPADTAEDLRQTTAWALSGHGTMTTRARNELNSRQADMGRRVRGHITDELGPAVDPIAGVDAIRQRVRTASAPGYAAAYAQPMVVTDDIARVMQTPAFRNALPQAVENIQNNLGDPRALGFRLRDDGTIDGIDTLSTEGFDQVVRAMGDSGRAAMDTSGFRPRDTTNSVHINNRARDLRQGIADHNDAYRDVTANYGDEMDLINGMQQGGDVAKLSGSEINAQRAALRPPGHEAWTTGARTALANTATTAGQRPTANVAQRVRQDLGFSGAGSHASAGDAEKLQAIETMSGRPGVMNRLDERLEGEDQAFKTFSEMAGNSKTQPRQAMDEALSGEALGVAQHVATGNIAGAVSSILFKGNPRGTLRFKRDVQDRIAQVMTASQPADIYALLGAVAERANTDRAFRSSLSRAGISVAKLAALQAAGQDADPIPVELEDGQVLLGFQNDDTTGGIDAPVYGKLGTHYPPSH